MLPLSLFGALYLAVLVHDRWNGAKLLNRAVWLIMAGASMFVYKVGATVNQEHLLKCLELDPMGEACYWNPHFMPFASLLDGHDLRALLSHRSTASEVVTALLLLALVRWWPEPRRGRRNAAPHD